MTANRESELFPVRGSRSTHRGRFSRAHPLSFSFSLSLSSFALKLRNPLDITRGSSSRRMAQLRGGERNRNNREFAQRYI